MSNSPRPVRFAVVGLGLMGQRHCQVISAVTGAELAGVCDSELAVSETIGEKYQAKIYRSFDQLLKSGEIDAAVLCLPSGLHAEFGIMAARSNLHVVVEKPIDSHLGPAQQLVEECQSRARVCAVISQYRYGRGLQALKWAIDSGALGAPVLARASVKWYRHDAYYTESRWRGRRAGENGGVLINQAVHAIDTLQWLFGEPDCVACMTVGSRPAVMETEDTAAALFGWNAGLLASLEASTSAAPGFDETFEINAPAGTIRVCKGEVDYWWHRDGIQLPAAFTATPADSPEPAHHEKLSPKLQLFARQYENIIAAINGEADLDVRPEQALAVLRTITRLYQTSETAV